MKSNTRKLKASWEPDFLQDLNSFQYVKNKEIKNFYIRNLITEKYQPIQWSAEEELTNILSSEIALAIDKEIISNIFNLNEI